MSSIATILTDIWQWVRFDIFGSDILAGFFVLAFVYAAASSLDLPVPQTVAFTLPVALTLIALGYMGWFGWLIVVVAALLFGVIIYRIYGVR